MLRFIVNGLKAVVFFFYVNLNTLYNILLAYSYHVNYDSREDDIFIVTYPKSGTTWLQMILYQLMTDGSMDIGHINQFAPDLEKNIIGTNKDMSTMPSPRVFKTHAGYQTILKGKGKYIYIMRDGRDVALSYYHHYQKFQRFQGSFDDFFQRFLAGKVAFGSWAAHVEGWYKNEKDLDVLYLTYEELSHDFRGCLNKIIAHCNLTVDPAKIPRIVERSSFSYMKAHDEKFDLVRGLVHQMGLGLDNEFLRKGKTGGWQEIMNQEQLDAYEAYSKPVQAAVKKA